MKHLTMSFLHVRHTYIHTYIRIVIWDGALWFWCNKNNYDWLHTYHDTWKYSENILTTYRWTYTSLHVALNDGKSGWEAWDQVALDVHCLSRSEGSKGVSSYQDHVVAPQIPDVCVYIYIYKYVCICNSMSASAAIKTMLLLVIYIYIYTWFFSILTRSSGWKGCWLWSWHWWCTGRHLAGPCGKHDK